MESGDLILLLIKGVFFWMVLGAVIAAATGISSQTISRIIRIGVIRIFYPSFIVLNILKGLDPSALSRLWMYIVAAIGFITIACCVSQLTARIGRVTDELPSYHFANSLHNYGFIAFAIIDDLFGAQALAEIFVFVITVEVVVWTWGVWMVSGGGQFTLRKVLNPPFLACVVGITAVSGFGLRVGDGGVWPILEWVAALNVPVALACVGGLLFHVVRDTRLHGIGHRAIWIALGTRHLLLPPLLCGLVLALIPEGLLQQNLLAEAVMPMALFPVAIARIYNAPHERIGIAIALSHMLAVVSIPFWLMRFAV